MLMLLAFASAYSQKIILSGVEGGSYNLLAKDIQKITQVSTEVGTSTGSVYNFNQLIAVNDTDISFMQYDVLKYFRDIENAADIDKLKVILPLSFEEIHLIVLKDAPINCLADLKGKNVAIGSLTQGTNVTAKLIKHITMTEWVDVDLGFKDVFASLLSGQIDAFFFVGASPVGKLNELSERSKNLIKLVPIENPKLQNIYKPTVIKKGTYRWEDKDIPTFSVQSLLVANTAKETPEEIKSLELLLTDIKNNIEKLRKEGHPKWKEIDFDFSKVKWEIHPSAKKIFDLK